MNQAAAATPRRRPKLLEPLKEQTFRNIWLASVLSNLGQLIQSVGAAWEMTRLTSSAQDVALVQTASMLPLMLLSLPAGAIADMYDRRKIALIGLGMAFTSAAALTAFSLAGLATPVLLLVFCFIIGASVALINPAWQASIRDQVSAEHLPTAVTLGSVSYNLARSFGPALGGVIVAVFSATAAFALNAVFYIPLIMAFWRWRRVQTPSRLPPERVDRAIVAGLRYAVHSPQLRILLLRTTVTALAGAALVALTPLVAKDLLGGGATTYGLLLGAFGLGAVIGALALTTLRQRLSAEALIAICAVAMGLSILVVAISSSTILTCVTLVIAGALWMLMVAHFNVAVQLSAPRWVTARTVACFSSALTGGIAIGAWGWGAIASAWGTGPALMASGVCIALTPLLGLIAPMPEVASAEEENETERQAPEISLPLTLRSGPIVIELDYRVDSQRARDFYGAMQKVRRARMRSGAFDWSLSRDIADQELWTERYTCPTWGDYLRQRDRRTISDRESEDIAQQFHQGDIVEIRRRLERPFGSVRWQEETPTSNGETMGPFTP